MDGADGEWAPGDVAAMIGNPFYARGEAKSGDHVDVLVSGGFVV